jgi:hypothetical protein
MFAPPYASGVLMIARRHQGDAGQNVGAFTKFKERSHGLSMPDLFGLLLAVR